MSVICNATVNQGSKGVLGLNADVPLPVDSSDRKNSSALPEKLPMSGVRVLDVGTFLAGPHAASILGEFGAEVLKIEHPIAGDPMRRFGTPTSAMTRPSPGSPRAGTESQ